MAESAPRRSGQRLAETPRARPSNTVTSQTFISASQVGSASDLLSDYDQPIVLQFESCVEEVCGNIRILDDSIMEPLVEDFIVSLEPFRTDIRVTLSPQPSTVEIIDDDGKCT